MNDLYSRYMQVPYTLDELKVLENYIPADMSGNQSKLTGGNDDE